MASALHVGKFRGYFSIAHGEDIDAAEVPRLTIAHLAVDPGDYGAIAADDDFLGLELGVGVTREPRAPELDDGGLAFDALRHRSGWKTKT
jgi:hypothetical protein